MIEQIGEVNGIACVLSETLPELKELGFSAEAIYNKWGIRSSPLKVAIYTAAGFPMYKRPGAPREGIKLTTELFLNLQCSPSNRRPCCSVAVRGENYTKDSPVVWYCDLLAFVIIDDGRPLAFVRWYAEETEERFTARALTVGLKVVKREKQQRPKPGGGSITVDYTDLINVDDILGPAYLQPVPKKSKKASGRYYVNPL